MESNKIRIESILANGEHINLECKKATNAIPNSIWETYSSFANTYGGTILLGIVENLKEKDIKKRFQVVGVEDSQKIITDFWNTINSNKVNENILSDNDVNVIDIDGKKVVYINVPQADWRIKPIYLNDNIYKGTYKRNQEGDYRCTERQVRAMIRDSFEDGNDGILLEHYTMDDIDLDSLHRYRNLFRVWNTDHVWNE
ncbi:MAG: ATP-binding protein, partial [Bacteroidales bacterium]|nr:ATP-binding protein [Bacteroidales bacterium]